MRALTDFGMPVGPFGMQDIAGIDVGCAHPPVPGVDRQDARARDRSRRCPTGCSRWAATGRRPAPAGTGTKPAAATRIHDPLVDQIAAEEAAKRGHRAPAVADDEIIARIMTALANEGARVLEEGYATRASDIDVIYCYGFGFPRHRGGPMFYADTVGLADRARARAASIASTFGDYWKAAALLERLVAEGRGF